MSIYVGSVYDGCAGVLVLSSFAADAVRVDGVSIDRFNDDGFVSAVLPQLRHEIRLAAVKPELVINEMSLLLGIEGRQLIVILRADTQ